MTIAITTRADNLDAVTMTTGVVVEAKRYGTPKGCTLGVGTYYFPIGSSEAPTASDTPLVSAHLQWAAAVAATITYETSNFPAKEGGAGVGSDDTPDYAASTGWVPENPSSAVVPVNGSGNSSTAATVTAGGSAAGECMFHLGNIGSRRARIKVVTTVAGVVRCGINGKV